MSQTIPLTITPEASAYMAEHGLEEAFQQMLENIPRRMAAVQAIAVSLFEFYDPPGELRIILEVTREHPGTEDDPTDRQWGQWIVETFSPEVFSHFIVDSVYGPPHAR